MIDTQWIKNAGQGSRANPHPVPVTVSLNFYIRFYLDFVRPLLADQPKDSFWINTKGNPLSSDICRKYIKDLIQEITQKELNIRLLRLNINNHFFESGPHLPHNQLWWNILMDHSPETEREYYRVWETEKWSHESAINPHPFMVDFFFFSFLT